MIEDTGRRAFILGITLTEVLVLFIFLLALLIGGTMQARQEEEAALSEFPSTVPQLQKALLNAKRQVDLSAQQMSLLQSKYQSVVDENETLKDLAHIKQKMEDDFKQSSAILSALEPLLDQPQSVDFLHEFARTVDDESSLRSLEARTDLLSDVLKADEQSMQICAELLVEQAQTDEYEQTDVQEQALTEEPMDVQECTGRLRYLEKRYASGISDVPPPCWLSPSGRSQSLFVIDIDGQGFRVQRAWPDSRADDVLSIPNALTLVGSKQHNRGEFLGATQALFYQSVKLQCRHVVDVRDDIDNNKELYKERIETIETHFYKRLLR